MTKPACTKDRCYSPLACSGFGYCRNKNMDFVDEVRRLFGIDPAPYKRAIAMQRFQKGENVREVISDLYGT